MYIIFYLDNTYSANTVYDWYRWLSMNFAHLQTTSSTISLGAWEVQICSPSQNESE